MKKWVSFAGGAWAAGLTLLGTGCRDHKETVNAPRVEQGRGIEEKKQAPVRAFRGHDPDLPNSRRSGHVPGEDVPASNNAETAGGGSAAQPRKQVAEPGMFVSPDSATPTAASPNNGLPPGESPLVQGEASGAIKITLAGSVLFDPGNAELKTSAHATLLSLCRTIRSRHPDNFIRVEGHTDSTPIVRSRGKYPDNMALSMARARSVCRFMVDEGGMHAQRVHTAGYGEFRPLVQPENTAGDKARNRRVEIVILPQVNVRKESLALDSGAAMGSHKRIHELNQIAPAKGILPSPAEQFEPVRER